MTAILSIIITIALLIGADLLVERLSKKDNPCITCENKGGEGMIKFLRRLRNWLQILFTKKGQPTVETIKKSMRGRQYNTGIGSISYKINCRSSQNKRRKLQRRVA